MILGFWCLFFQGAYSDGTPPQVVENRLENPSDLQLMKLGKWLHMLHGLPCVCLPKPTFKERLLELYDRGVKGGMTYSVEVDRAIEEIRHEPRVRRLVPSHGALSPAAIRVQGERMSFVPGTDFTWDDPYVDLSYFCVTAHLSSAQEKVLLEGYFTRAPTEEEWETLQQEKEKVNLYHFLYSSLPRKGSFCGGDVGIIL